MSAVASFLIAAIWVYTILIFVSAALSWFPSSGGGMLNDIRRWLDRVTDPYLNIFRRVLHSIGVGSYGVDLSPMLGIVVLYIAQIALSRI